MRCEQTQRELAPRVRTANWHAARIQKIKLKRFDQEIPRPHISHALSPAQTDVDVKWLSSAWSDQRDYSAPHVASEVLDSSAASVRGNYSAKLNLRSRGLHPSVRGNKQFKIM